MTIQECIKNEFSKNKNMILVFPTEISAKKWADWTVKNTEVKAVAMERFTAWDKFKETCIKSIQQNKTSVPSVMRKIFASWIIQENSQLDGGIFHSLIKREFIESSSSFADWIASILPSLGTWKIFHDNKDYLFAIENKFGKSSEAVLEELDYEILYRKYSEFLETFNYFEPAWEKPPFNDNGNKYVIIYPEILEDYCEYRQILADAQKDGILSIINIPQDNADYFVDFEDNSRSEIQNVALYLRKCHENGIAWPEMAISVPDMDSYGSYIDRELDLHEIPHTMRYSKPLTSYGAGQLLAQIQECNSRNFSFDSLKSLLLNEDIPWKKSYLINRLINFGKDNNCILSFGDKDIWEESFKCPKDKSMLSDQNEYLTEIQEFYENLKNSLCRFQNARTFSALYDSYNHFKSEFIYEPDFLPVQNDDGTETPSDYEQSNKILGRCVAELKNLVDLEKEIRDKNSPEKNKYQVKSPFSFWTGLLEKTEYLEQNSSDAVQIYTYKTSATAPFGLQVIVDSTQNSLALATKALRFLSEEKREIIKKIDSSYEDIDTGSIFISLYKSNSEQKVLFTGATHSFNGYGFLHAAIQKTGHEITDEQLSYNPYKSEKNWLLQENSSAPESVYEKSVSGIKKWLLQQKSDGKNENPDSEKIGELLSDIIKNKFFDKDSGTYKISCSTLKAYYECPRKWLFKDVLGLKPLNNESELKDSFIDGTINHLVFELYFKNFENKTIPDDVHLELLNKCYDAALAKFQENNTDSWKNRASVMTMEIFRSEKRTMLEKLHDSIKALCTAFNGWKVYAAEKTLTAFPKDKKYSFYGTIDLILYQETHHDVDNSTSREYAIVDYKASKGAIPKVIYVDEKKYNQNIDFQLPMYVYLCANSTEKIQISRSDFFNMKDAKLGRSDPIFIYNDPTDTTMNEFLQKADDFFEKTILNQEFLVNKIFQNKKLCANETDFGPSCVDYRPICRRFFTICGEETQESQISQSINCAPDIINPVKTKRSLSEEQAAAKNEMRNVVVSAGAGSGKTTVLADRYEKIVQDGTPVDKILTLTFTNKASNEMKSRIFKKLSDDGLNTADFDKAHIQTLDSYFNEIAKLGAHFYGVTPSFQMDEEKVKKEIEHSALKFLLEKKNDPEYEKTIVELSRVADFESLAKNIFSETLTKYDNLCEPIDFVADFENQTKAMAEFFNGTGYRALSAVKLLYTIYGLYYDDFNNATGSTIANFVTTLKESAPPTQPIISEKSFENDDEKQKITDFLVSLGDFCKIKIPGKNCKADIYKRYCDTVSNFRTEFYKLVAVENFVAGYETKKKTMELLTQFQKQINNFKRTTGNLTFSDISGLAHRILKDHPEIRHQEQEKYSKIMIDEFQDNNQQQCDVLFMLADTKENEKFDENGNYLIPTYEELQTRLSPQKLFFVGDEKQSIYSFRGADVTVFNKLKEKTGNQKNLDTNYRSEKSLIDAFNLIFGGNPLDKRAPSIFMTQGIKETWQLKDKPEINELLENEPVYTYVNSAPGKKASPQKLVKIAMLNTYDEEEENPADKEETAKNSKNQDDKSQTSENQQTEEESANVYEAKWIAREINRLVGTEYTDSNGNVLHYKYQDFCLLFRSTTYLSIFESELLHSGIPYSTEVYKGFFSDGPINDLVSYLRLCVYQNDYNSYAKILRSPFVNLSFAEMEKITVLTKQKNREINNLNHNEEITSEQRIQPYGPFDERLLTENLGLSESSAKKFKQACKDFNETKQILHSQKLTKTLSHLWYDLGYRYETMWNKEVSMYASLYDILFEIARKSEQKTQGLADFLDEIEEYKNSSSKIEGLDLPQEASDSVKIMTIHKSKGLEFKVVFVCAISNGENTGKSTNDSISYNKKRGVIVRTPESYNLDEICQHLTKTAKKEVVDDFFIDEFIREQNFKNCAELRRINYVACTRAERLLYLVGHYDRYYKGNFIEFEKDKQTKFVEIYQPGILEEPLPYESEQTYKCPDTLYEEMLPLMEYYTFKNEKTKIRIAKPQAPFDFIEFKSDEFISSPKTAGISENSKDEESAIAGAENSLFDENPEGDDGKNKSSGVVLRKNTKSERLDFTKYAEKFYENPELKVLTLEIPEKTYLSPSSLGEHFENSLFEETYPEVNAIVKKSGGRFKHTNFGSIAHAFFEAKMKNQRPQIKASDLIGLDNNEELLNQVFEIAEKMTGQFEKTELYAQIAQATQKYGWLRAEFDFRYKAEELPVIVNGQIDLLVQSGDSNYLIVDYKTDQTICPQEHYAQLACYRQAVSQMMNVPAENITCQLYYMRFGKSVDITENCTKEIFTDKAKNILKNS